MAEIVTDSELRPRRRYPWNEWTDGQARRIVRGEDFDVTAATMRVQIYSEAGRRGLRASARLEGIVGAEDAVTFRFYPKVCQLPACGCAGDAHP